MSINVDKEFVKHVAEVARLKLTDKEVEKFVPQMKEIIDTFSKLQEVDVEGVEPSFQPIAIDENLREDKIEKSLSQEEALRNSKANKEGYFLGPKAI